MSYLNWFLCLFSILSEKTFVSSQNTRRDQIIFNYNNTYKYNVPYTVYVNRDIEYIMEFAGDSEAYETPARVNIASDFANRTYPLFVTARQQKGVFSWQLPMLVQTPVSLEQFTNISRTLCPHNNLFSEEEDTCDVSTLNTPIVHLTSASPDPIEATIVVETVTDFYIKLNSTTNLTSTPSQPKYYFFPFDQGPKLDVKSQSLKRKYNCNKHLDNSEQRLLDRYLISSTNFDQYGWLSRPKSVIVMIESEDEICAVVSIQNFSCPVFDNERDILYDGYYLTMTKRGGITLTQDTFPLGFYIVFIVKSSDEDCSDTTLNSTVPNYGRKYFTWDDQVVVASNEGRVKKFSFKIIQMISYQEYMIAAGAALAFFLCFYVGFINAVIRQIFKIIQTISYQEYMIAAGAALAFFLCFYVGFIIAVIWQRKTRRSNVMHESNRSEGTASTNVTVSTATTSAARRRRVDVHSSNRCLVDTDGRGDRSSSSDTESECSTHDDNIDNEMCINAGKLCVANLASLGMSTHEDNIDNEMYINAGKLCVANLARCRPRVLSARSKMYLFNVLTVAVFYTLPVIQLVVTYQRLLNQSGNQDLCYFNFLCAHPLLVLSDFNHVYSNLGYVLLGALFLIAVWRRQAEYTRSGYEQKELGIPQHFGLLYAMGIALVSEGLLSAAYHVCPNSMNFQFDTSFMYVTSVLCMVKIYQSRHPDINARAHATFAVLALIIFIGLVGVLNANFYFWVAFTVLHLVTCLVMTFQIYYLGRFRLDGAILTRAARFLARQPLSAITPARVGRCAMLAIANLANWALAAYGVAQHSKDFASHLLLVLMSNLFLYTLFYIVMKLLHRESIRWYTWVYIFLTYTIWFSSSYFYLDQNTNWALTPAQSRQSNSVCSLLQLYDSHDIWHFMSSTAMFFSFNMYLTIDDNLADVPRSEIMVF